MQGVTKPCTSVGQPNMFRAKNPVQSSSCEFVLFSTAQPIAHPKVQEEKEGKKRNLDCRQTGWGNRWPANKDAHSSQPASSLISLFLSHACLNVRISSSWPSRSALSRLSPSLPLYLPSSSLVVSLSSFLSLLPYFPNGTLLGVTGSCHARPNAGYAGRSNFV